MIAPGSPEAVEDDRLARIALSRLGEPGRPTMARLVAAEGAVGVRDRLLAAGDPETEQVARALAETDPARDLEVAARQGIRYVTPYDDEWPQQVGDLAHAEPIETSPGALMGGLPLGLWVRGPIRLDTLAGAVAVVGSRSSTSYGDEVAGEIAASVAAAGRAVVSGAAFGIDVMAHRGALAAGGVTVAVLACGADRVYPAAHQRLIEHLAEHGAVVSETPLGWAPLRPRFLTRNRIIAALGAGTVVVEAALRSGALDTANWTGRLNRPLMAVPGPVTSAGSEGCHELVRRGAASLVTRGADVLELVGASGQHLLEVPRGPERARDGLPMLERTVLEAVPVANAAPAASIARTAGVGPGEVRSALAALEARGLARQDDDGWRLTAAAHR